MAEEGVALIAGLGNPGAQYARSRHNAGFWLVDELARRDRVHLRPDIRFHAELARWSFDQGDCWLLKPTTSMNRSGSAIGSLARFYRLPAHRILVAHDELDLPPGVARIKQGGGHGGHNGLRDIIAHLGENGFLRLRIGIGHPGDREIVTPYVLSAPSTADRELIEQAIAEAADTVPLLLQGRIQPAMNRLHSPR